MAQASQNILPQYLNLDAGFNELEGDESSWIKDLSNELNANPDLGLGMNNPSNEGQTTTVLTPTRANVLIPDVILPEGYNKCVGSFESKTTQEFYHCNFNSENQFGIYVYSGNTGVWQKVIIDPELLFSDEPEAFMAEHRCSLRTRTNAQGEIIEKYLLITDGTTYHKWIDVIAAIKTDGFNSSLYSYFNLQPPHFDRQELLAWAIRSPMIAPTCTLLPNTDSQNGTPNKILNFAWQFCYQDIFTDGRQTLSSPFSLPIIVKTAPFLTNPNLIPKRIGLEMDAGSCKVEKRNIFYRRTARKAGSDIEKSFGDWYLYDTINKFTNIGNNSPSVIGNDYWIRTGAWSDYTYNPLKNTIKYIFDATKLGLITDQSLFTRLGNDMPQLSVASSDLGDAVQLANNRYGFGNFSDSITSKLSTDIIETDVNSCARPLRTLKLYVYAGRDRANFRTHFSDSDGEIAGGYSLGVWISQVGYISGEDTQTRFGGMYYDTTGDNVDFRVMINPDESKEFDLDFADKKGFRCYLKGTPYFADCEWHISNQNFQLQKISGQIDTNDISDMNLLTSAYKNYSFFVGVFTFRVPAGRYIATLGRHNVASDGNYRDTSTYIMGIANSRKASISQYESNGIEGVKLNTIKPNAITTRNKEIEIDCTNGDVDLWTTDLTNPLRGDCFYVLTPFNGYANAGGLFTSDNNNWRFVEGYLYESQDDKIPIERFYYELKSADGYAGHRETGVFTDKNGFWFGYSWYRDDRNTEVNAVFTNKKDCTPNFQFTVDVQLGAGWFHDIIAYFDNYNGGVVGTANRILINGTVRDLTNTIPYSNIAISLFGGQTVYTDDNGEFTVIAHNGATFLLSANIYINSSGTFNITTANCGFVPIYNFTEPICQTTQIRRVIIGTINIDSQNTELTSLKEAATYIIGIVGADIASRITYVNKFSTKEIPSFQKRNNTNATKLKWILNGNLNLQNDIETYDIKWLSFFIVNSTYNRYVQWVGNSMEFVDTNGNVTTDSNSAALVKIDISSLLKTNIQNNFTLIANYQFKNGDRLRVLDDGDGNLLNTAIYGEEINIEVQGTNYNQAAINANLIPPSENVVLDQNATAGDSVVYLYVKYDKRFDVLKDKSGFGIELYTPTETTELFPFSQIESFYPVINGNIAEYVSGGQANPVYNFLNQGELNYWDTYLIRRNIFGLGQYISHPFESPNITDTWGANVTSGGKVNTINNNSQRLWYNDNTIKSDDYITNGVINGLANFLEKNKKDFKGYQRGGIVAILCQYSTILFICENDWFVTDYNFQYIYANSQGVQVANLDQNLSVPHQKVGQNFGCRLKDTATVISFDEYVWWIDVKNQGAILCDYRQAADISSITGKDDEGNEKLMGIQSYLYEKINTIERWNDTHDKSERFDIVCGLDEIRKKIYLTFRPRRKNTNNELSYVSKRRNIDLQYQESIVFDVQTKRWNKFTGLTPEAYGKVRGNNSGVEFIAFAAGKPYLQNKSKSLFTNFFGVQLEPSMFITVNKNNDVVKVLESLSVNLNNSGMYSDLIYSTQKFGYSYLPFNFFKEEEKISYAAFRRDMISYLQDPVNGDYRSTFMDGKRLFGEYFLIRLIQEFNSLGQYFQLNNTSALYTSSTPVKPPQV